MQMIFNWVSWDRKRLFSSVQNVIPLVNWTFAGDVQWALVLNFSFKWCLYYIFACNPPSSLHSIIFSLSTAPTLQIPHPSDLFFLPCFLPPFHDPTVAAVILCLLHQVPLVDWQSGFSCTSPRHCHSWRCSGCSMKADTSNLWGCLLLGKITPSSGKYRAKMMIFNTSVTCPNVNLLTVPVKGMTLGLGQSPLLPDFKDKQWRC